LQTPKPLSGGMKKARQEGYPPDVALIEHWKDGLKCLSRNPRTQLNSAGVSRCQEFCRQVSAGVKNSVGRCHQCFWQVVAGVSKCFGRCRAQVWLWCVRFWCCTDFVSSLSAGRMLQCWQEIVLLYRVCNARFRMLVLCVVDQHCCVVCLQPVQLTILCFVLSLLHTRFVLSTDMYTHQLPPVWQSGTNTKRRTHTLHAR
jgi:hypothetical protein